MYRFALSFVAAPLAIFSASISNAQSFPENSCETDGYVIALQTGILSPATTTRRELNLIQSLIGPTFEGRPIRYIALQNTTATNEGAAFGVLDIAELLAQRARERSDLVEFRGRTEIHHRAAYSDERSLNTFEREGDAAVDTTVSMYRAVLQNVLFDSAALNRTYEATLGRLEQVDLDANRRDLYKQTQRGFAPVIIGHSQGALFVNKLYDETVDEISNSSLKTYYIAPASQTTRGGGEYVLSPSDEILKLLEIDGGTLRPRGPNPGTPPGSINGHSLANAYLSNASSRNEIIAGIRRALDAAEPLNCTRTFSYDGQPFTRARSSDLFGPGEINGTITIQGLGPGYTGFLGGRTFPEFIKSYSFQTTGGALS